MADTLFVAPPTVNAKWDDRTYEACKDRVVQEAIDIGQVVDSNRISDACRVETGGLIGWFADRGQTIVARNEGIERHRAPLA